MKRTILIGHLKADAYRLLVGFGFYLSIMLTFFTQLQPIIRDIRMSAASSDVLYLFRLTAETGTMQRLIPCIAALPFSIACFADYQSRYVRMILQRGNRRSYLVSKVTVTAASAFIAVFLGMLLFVLYLILCYRYPLIDYATDGSWPEWAKCSFGGFVVAGQPYAFFLAQIIVRSLGAAVWAVSALAVSAFVPNRFFIVLSPVVISYVVECIDTLLYNTCLPGYDGVRYIELGITKASNPYSATILSLGVLLSLLTIMVVTFILGMSRRLKNV